MNNMANFKIKIEGLTEFGKIQLETIAHVAEEHISRIAKTSALVMREHVRASIQRPNSSGNLERAIFAQPIDNLSWGVGNIEYMNKTVPYWAWINYGVAGTGRRVPPATTGSFNPGNPKPEAGSFRQGRWIHGGEYFMQPNRPIQPHNFIQRTIDQQNQIIASVLNSRII